MCRYHGFTTALPSLPDVFPSVQDVTDRFRSPWQSVDLCFDMFFEGLRDGI